VILMIYHRGHRLKKRVAQLVEAAGQRVGLKRVDPRKGNTTMKQSDDSDEDDSGGAGSTDVSPQPSEVSPQA